MNYRALIVGLGRIAWRGFPENPSAETHYATLSAHPNIEVCGGVDTNESARLAFQEAAHVPVYEDIDAALRDTLASIVVVATPASTHADMVCQAALHDCVRGILCEKPMAETVDDCSRMAVSCYRKNKVLLIGHQRRYEQSHRLVRSFIKSEALGKPYGGHSIFPGTDWLTNGTHAVDTMRFLLGDEYPFSVRLGKPNTRFFECTVACRYGKVYIESYKYLVAGYQTNMYNDLIECMESDKRPECSADDGTEAVRQTLANQEMWRETAA